MYWQILYLLPYTGMGRECLPDPSSLLFLDIYSCTLRFIRLYVDFFFVVLVFFCLVFTGMTVPDFYFYFAKITPATRRPCGRPSPPATCPPTTQPPCGGPPARPPCGGVAARLSCGGPFACHVSQD